MKSKPSKKTKDKKKSVEEKKSFAARFWPEIIIALVAALCDFNSWGHRFVMDDLSRILGNGLLRTPQFVFRMFEAPYDTAKTLYRPFTSFTFAINWWLGGPNPDGFHAANRLIHILVCLGIFWVIRRLFQNSLVLALVTSLLYAVHPVQTEAITYINGRSDALAMLFLVFTWLFFLRARKSNPFSWRSYSLSLVSFFLGLLSKESTVTWVGVLFLTEFVFFAERNIKRFWEIVRGQFGRVYAGYGVVLGIYLGLRFAILHNVSHVTVTYLDNPLAHVSLPVRLLTGLKIMFQSAGLIVWPIHLSADYSFNQIALVQSWRSVPAIVTILLTLGLCGVLVWTFRRAPDVFFGLGYFLLTYSIISNIIVPIGTIRADRLLYMPALGICFMAACIFERLEQRLEGAQLRKWPKLALAVILVLMLIRVISRNSMWRNEFTLYSQTVRDAPHSAKAHHNLGVQYAARKEFDKAFREYQQAMQIKPDYPDLLNSLGSLMFQQGKRKEAIDDLQRAVELAPENPNIRNNYGLMLRAEGHLVEAIAQYDWIIVHDPDNSDAHFNKANALHAQGRTQDAINEYYRTLQLDPTNMAARSNLNILIRQSGGTVMAPPQ
ncbi:MAG: tetratricopeptide repeat protein [Acidobacteriia bacterium]|nr:tetratricopeptide repeat protein [Terriglobia bacterium]